MKIHEAIKMLQRMNPNDDVFLQFTEDVVEQRNNEHLKIKYDENESGHGKRRHMDDRDRYYNQNESK